MVWTWHNSAETSVVDDPDFLTAESLNASRKNGVARLLSDDIAT
jgi:hypothetical protein